MRVKKSEPLKGVSVPSLDLIIDDIMAAVPRADLNLSGDATRAKLREWLYRIGRHIADNVANEMADAAGKAVKESAALFVNPRYYEDKKKRRDQRRIDRQFKQAEAANAGRRIKAFGKDQFIQ